MRGSITGLGEPIQGLIGPIPGLGGPISGLRELILGLRGPIPVLKGPFPGSGDTLYSFEVAVAPPMLNSAAPKLFLHYYFLRPKAIQNW